VKNRLVAQALTLAATLFLAGCYVIADNKPLQQGPQADEAIIGDWRSIDETTGKETNAFLHIQRPTDDGPLRLVFVEDKDLSVYTLTTTRAGNRRVFSAVVELGDDAPKGALLGYYEVEGDDLRFHLMDAEKISALIRAGKVAGIPAAKAYDTARLTASAAELSQFLASEDAWNARVSDASRMRRMRPQE